MNRKVNILTVNPSNPSELLAGMWHQGGDPIFRSTNGGETWEPYSTGLASMTISAIEFDTTHHRIYVGGWAPPGVQGVYFMDRITNVQMSGLEIPTTLSLTVFPNPFNNTTKLRFSLPYATPIRLRVFDLLEREVLPVVLGDRYEPGEHELAIDASGLASGVYIVSLQAGGLHRTAKLLLSK